jgi:type VI secretion system protein ImpE
MTAAEFIKAGDVDGALTALQNEVRAKPTDPKLRVFLFQLLCVRGEWERAQTQLNVCSEMDSTNMFMAQICRIAILCEKVRAEVFAGERTPMVLGEPEAWVGKLIQACAMNAKGQHQAAADLRAQAFEEAPTTSGTIEIGAAADKVTPHAFEWIADSDERLGPVLECLIEGKYYWAPFHRIHRITLDVPADLRDAIWLPATFLWTAGGETAGLIPVRYPGSEAAGREGVIRLSRKTDYIDDNGFTRPIGQKLLTTDAGEFGLLETRTIQFNTTLATPPPEAAKPA